MSSGEDMQRTKQLAAQVHSNSNFETRNEEPVCAMLADSINSDTRTKTAIFSNNGCSMEVIKDYTYLAALGHRGNEAFEGNDEESIQEPPGFEKVARSTKGMLLLMVL